MSCVCGLQDDQTCARQPCKRTMPVVYIDESSYPKIATPSPMQGWQCPVGKTVYSPLHLTCYCQTRWTVTYGGNK